MKDKLKRYFEKLSNSFTQDLERAASKGDKKSIHALRVNIKRLRALFLFLEHLSHGKANFRKASRKLEKLFSEAGEVRTHQIQSALFTEFNKKDKSITAELRRMKTKAPGQHKRFKKQVQEIDEKKLQKKMSNAFKEALPYIDNSALQKQIYAFSSASIKNSIRLAKGNSFHKARKKLKSAHYVLEISKSAKATRLLKLIDPLEKAAGRRQDLAIALDMLEKSRLKRKESKALRLMAGRMRQETKTLDIQLKADFRKLEKRLGNKR